MRVYLGGFANWGEVVDNFTPDDTTTTVPDEPKHVFALYHQESYEGSAVVIYKSEDKYFFVHGEHCSCNGLEELWEPSEETPETLRHVLTKGDGYYAVHEDDHPEFQAMALVWLTATLR